MSTTNPTSPDPRHEAWWDTACLEEREVILWYSTIHKYPLASDRMLRLQEFARLVLEIPATECPKRTELHVLAYQRFPEFKAYCLGYERADLRNRKFRAGH